MLNNKKILILGMARSGYEVSKLLCGSNELLITDSKDQDEDKIKELESLGIKFVKTDNPEELLDDSYDILIKNPAVFPNHKCVVKAGSLNIPVINEMEVAYHYIDKNVKIIGVTGSNGKTTTVSLIYEALKKAGLSVVLGGNIGIPLSKLVKELKDNDILLLEISDHQLIDFKDFKTDISILTNICPTHLDYHGNYENYKTVKKKIFNYHNSDNIAILNSNNIDSIELTKDIDSTKLYFNNEENYYKDNIIYVDNKEVINTNDILLRGIHNYENILSVLMLLKTLNIDYKYLIEVLKEFKGVEHRIEFVKEINKVKYYNDSKSTNPTSTITALKSFDKNIHLLLGGMERNQEFTDIKEYKNKIKCIYAFGEVRNRIIDFCKKYKIKYIEYNTISEIMKDITNYLNEEDIVLLSPGSASWDQYKKFEDRGNEFKELVNKL